MADCPFLDPAESSRTIAAFFEGLNAERPCAYASNTLERRVPRGLDTEVVSVAALRLAAESTDPADKEHVTRFVYRHSETFGLLAVAPGFEGDLSHHRWTLDTLDDYRLLHAIATRLGDAVDTADVRAIARLVDGDAHLRAINAHVQQKAD